MDYNPTAVPPKNIVEQSLDLEAFNYGRRQPVQQLSISDCNSTDLRKTITQPSTRFNNHSVAQL